MASRSTIRDAFMTELRAATTVPNDDVTLQGAEEEETLPQIVYNDNYRRNIYNGVGQGPHVVNRDSNDDVVDEEWHRFIEAQFLVEVRDKDEIQKETIYENLRTHFEAFTLPGLGIEAGTHPKDIHQDVIDVEVADANSNDAIDAEESIRADTLEVRIEFKRIYTLDTILMTQINLETDADLDSGSSGLTYTIT